MPARPQLAETENQLLADFGARLRLAWQRRRLSAQQVAGLQAQRSLGTVALAYDNPTAQGATLCLSAMAYAYRHSQAAPLPEPGVWLMLLAGLGCWL